MVEAVAAREVVVLGLDGGLVVFGVLHVSWTVTKNRFNRTCEVKSVLSPQLSRAKSSNSRSCWRALRNPCTISEVAKSYSLVPQTVRMLGEQMEENPFRHRG